MHSVVQLLTSLAFQFPTFEHPLIIIKPKSSENVTLHMSSWSIAAPKNEAFGRGLVRVIVLFGKHSVKHLFKNYFRELICQVKINIYHRIARTDVIVNQGLFNICFRQDKW